MNKLFIQSLENLQLGLGLSLHAVEVVKRDLYEAGFASFYSLALYGVPACGKTTIARACVQIGGEMVEMKGMRLEKIREIESSIDKGIFVIDDVPYLLKESSIKEQLTRLDEFPRRTYEGKSKGLIITMEETVKNMIPMDHSFAQRLIFLPCNGYVLDKRNTDCTDYLLENAETVTKFFDDFAAWYIEKNKKEACKDRLREYRAGLQCKEERLLRMNDFIFLYKLVMRLLADFIEEKYKQRLSLIAIEKNCQTIMEERNKSPKPLVMELFMQVLDKQYLKVYCPDALCQCQEFCAGNCTAYDNVEYPIRECSGTETAGWDCGECPYLTKEAFYYAEDLRLPEKRNAVILISDLNAVHQCRLNIHEPVLIIRTSYLEAILNDQLKVYNKKHKTQKNALTAIQWAKEIMNGNGCMYKLISKSEPGRKGPHMQYQFQYPAIGDDMKVIIIRLTEEMKEVLEGICEIDLLDRVHNGVYIESHNKLCSELSQSFRDLQYTASDPWDI